MKTAPATAAAGVRCAAALAAWLPGFASAHAFDDRYELPVPLAYFTTGAALTVALAHPGPG